MRSRIAPVNDPRTCPKNSLSNSSRGIEPQLTLTSDLPAAPAALVDRARDQFLACATLSQNQYVGLGPRHGVHFAQHASQRSAAPEDVAERARLLQFLTQIVALELQRATERVRLFGRACVGNRNGCGVR